MYLKKEKEKKSHMRKKKKKKKKKKKRTLTWHLKGQTHTKLLFKVNNV